MAAFHDEVWSPSDDAIREKWLEKAQIAALHGVGMEAKFAMAALYLDPSSKQFLVGRILPQPLERLIRAGRTVQGLPNRAKWVATWFPVLDPEPNHPGRYASFAITGWEIERRWGVK